MAYQVEKSTKRHKEWKIVKSFENYKEAVDYVAKKISWQYESEKNGNVEYFGRTGKSTWDYRIVK